jgi:phosphoglycerate dehydrogenase-like enzyme
MSKLSLILALAASLPLLAQQKKILVSGLSPDAIRELQSAAPKAKVVGITDRTAPAEVADADAILGTIKPEWVRAGKKLKWFQTYSAGVEPYLLLSEPDLMKSGITVTNCKIIQGPEIADHALAMLLTLTRGLHRIVANRTKEEWDQKSYDAIELRGKTAVVIGVGGIGTQIATRAHGFGMKVIGVDPKDIPFMPVLERVVRPDRLDEVLPLADVLFISAPHTAESQGMVGPRQFELLKRNAYFIAVSRGKLYDMPSLVKALDSKRIAGAGVDVTDPEPLPKGHPLWKFDNAIITPHVATRSDQVQARRMEILKENVQRFTDGRPLLHVVDKERGY